jgi:hypothetical protein
MSGTYEEMYSHENKIHKTEMYNFVTQEFDEIFKVNEYYKNN